jgi:four helix bundle protein
MVRFRFEILEIWKRAADIATKLFKLADILEKNKLYRFADQLRGAGLSMPNNIAEGSGSTSKKEFIQFLNIARRSTSENASMILIFAKEKLISEEMKDEIIKDLDELMQNDHFLFSNSSPLVLCSMPLVRTLRPKLHALS